MFKFKQIVTILSSNDNRYYTDNELFLRLERRKSDIIDLLDKFLEKITNYGAMIFSRNGVKFKDDDSTSPYCEIIMLDNETLNNIETKDEIYKCFDKIKEETRKSLTQYISIIDNLTNEWRRYDRENNLICDYPNHYIPFYFSESFYKFELLKYNQDPIKDITSYSKYAPKINEYMKILSDLGFNQRFFNKDIENTYIRYKKIFDILNLLKNKKINIKENKETFIKLFEQLGQNYYITLSSELINNINKTNNENDILLMIQSFNNIGIIDSYNEKEADISKIQPIIINFFQKYNYPNNVTKVILKNLTPFICAKFATLNYSSHTERHKSVDLFFKSLKGKDGNFIKKQLEIANFNQPNFYIHSDIFVIADDLIEEGTYTTYENFIKTIEILNAAAKILHNIGAPREIKESVITLVFENKIDVRQDIIEKIIETVFNKEYQNIIDIITDKVEGPKLEIIEFAKESKLNLTEIINDFNLIKDMFLSKQIKGSQSINYDLTSKILNLNSSLEMISVREAVKKYIAKAKPKDPALFKLNYKVNEDTYFKVLEDLNPAYFTIGATTNCCQRLGGAGEAAAIDSFINPLAGVLVLYYKNMVVAQSYFHYVPEDNGVILDNVETNRTQLKKSGIPINEYYAALAKQAQADLNLKYFRCGLEYNKLDEEKFKMNKLKKDNRDFEHDEIYSDYSNTKHLDLLQPKFEITPETNIQLTKMAKATIMRLKSAIHTFNKLIKV